MSVRLECEDCADEEREDEFTLHGEWFLDGSFLWYCDYGHTRLRPTRVVYKYRNKRRHRNSHLMPRWAKPRDDYELLSHEGYHKHSNYGIHPLTREHRKTTEKHRRFADFNEWKDINTNNQIRGREKIEEAH